MSQQGSRLATRRLKLLHSLALNAKGAVEMVQSWFLTNFCCSPCWLSSLAPHVSEGQVQVDLYAFSPRSLVLGTQARLAAMTLVTRWGLGDHSHPFFFLTTWVSGGSFDCFGCCNTDVGNYQAGAAQGLLVSTSPALLQGQLCRCALPALILLSAGTLGSCAVELWSDREGFPTTLPSSCLGRALGFAGCHALVAQPDSCQRGNKICAKPICCLPQETEGSKCVCCWWPRKKLLRSLSGILDHLRTIVFALLSKHLPDCIPELMFHFRWDLGRFTCCQVVTLTAWQSPVKQIGPTYFLTMRTT